MTELASRVVSPPTGRWRAEPRRWRRRGRPTDAVSSSVRSIRVFASTTVASDDRPRPLLPMDLPWIEAATTASASRGSKGADRRSGSGIALPVTLIVITIGFALASVGSIAAMSSLRNTTRDESSKEAVAVAEAGLDQALLRQNKILTADGFPCLVLGAAQDLIPGYPLPNGWCPRQTGTVDERHLHLPGEAGDGARRARRREQDHDRLRGRGRRDDATADHGRLHVDRRPGVRRGERDRPRPLRVHRQRDRHLERGDERGHGPERQRDGLRRRQARRGPRTDHLRRTPASAPATARARRG